MTCATITVGPCANHGGPASGTTSMLAECMISTFSLHLVRLPFLVTMLHPADSTGVLKIGRVAPEMKPNGGGGMKIYVEEQSMKSLETRRDRGICLLITCRHTYSCTVYQFVSVSSRIFSQAVLSLYRSVTLSTPSYNCACATRVPVYHSMTRKHAISICPPIYFHHLHLPDCVLNVVALGVKRQTRALWNLEQFYVVRRTYLQTCPVRIRQSTKRRIENEKNDGDGALFR
jgi:hypothetical protein